MTYETPFILLIDMTANDLFEILVAILNVPQTLGFSSGDCTRHGKTSILHCFSKIWTTLNICVRSLSCISWKLGTYYYILGTYINTKGWSVSILYYIQKPCKQNKISSCYNVDTVQHQECAILIIVDLLGYSKNF